MFVRVAQVHAAAQSEPGEQQPDDAAAVTLHAAHAGRAERGEQPAGGATARHPAPHQVSARRLSIAAVWAIFSMFEPNRVFDYKCNPVADSFEFCTITHMYVQFMYTYRVHVHVRT